MHMAVRLKIHRVQDEATELTGGAAKGGSAEKGLALLAQNCSMAAVTLGERGCLAQKHGEQAFAEPAARDITVVDATGSTSTNLHTWP